jgi:hypothetical protein
VKTITVLLASTIITLSHGAYAAQQGQCSWKLLPFEVSTCPTQTLRGNGEVRHNVGGVSAKPSSTSIGASAQSQPYEQLAHEQRLIIKQREIDSQFAGRE